MAAGQGGDAAPPWRVEAGDSDLIRALKERWREWEVSLNNARAVTSADTSQPPSSQLTQNSQLIQESQAAEESFLSTGMRSGFLNAAPAAAVSARRRQVQQQGRRRRSGGGFR